MVRCTSNGSRKLRRNWAYGSHRGSVGLRCSIESRSTNTGRGPRKSTLKGVASLSPRPSASSSVASLSVRSAAAHSIPAVHSRGKERKGIGSWRTTAAQGSLDMSVRNAPCAASEAMSASLNRSVVTKSPRSSQRWAALEARNDQSASLVPSRTQRTGVPSTRMRTPPGSRKVAVSGSCPARSVITPACFSCRESARPWLGRSGGR